MKAAAFLPLLLALAPLGTAQNATLSASRNSTTLPANGTTPAPTTTAGPVNPFTFPTATLAITRAPSAINSYNLLQLTPAPLRTITLAGSAPVPTTLTLAVVLDAAPTGGVAPDLAQLAPPTPAALVSDLVAAAAALARGLASAVSPAHVLVGLVVAAVLVAALELYLALGARRARASQAVALEPDAVEIAGQRGRLRARLYRKA
ncbi:hypothetical protein Q8F55_006299 [Vanrija albida]|uniref:Uncharacterized protein n=1 Tax=Vanrija albida TaxID=181172 RepID=A0ABR3PWP4_9TREE